jgi:hypothetical protein
VIGTVGASTVTSLNATSSNANAFLGNLTGNAKYATTANAISPGGTYNMYGGIVNTLYVNGTVIDIGAQGGGGVDWGTGCTAGTSYWDTVRVIQYICLADAAGVTNYYYDTTGAGTTWAKSLGCWGHGGACDPNCAGGWQDYSTGAGCTLTHNYQMTAYNDPSYKQTWYGTVRVGDDINPTVRNAHYYRDIVTNYYPFDANAAWTTCLDFGSDPLNGTYDIYCPSDPASSFCYSAITACAWIK